MTATLAVDDYGKTCHRLAMNNRGTIRDVTEWAERCLPGNESHARSAIVTIRKGGLFSYGKNGPRGKGAAFMVISDFATALLAILHDGAATKSDEIVQTLWALSLTQIEIDDPEHGQAVQMEPREMAADLALPYLARFKLEVLTDKTMRANLLVILTQLYTEYAPFRDFNAADHVSYESCGDAVSVKIVLHGGNRIMPDGWHGSGPDHSAVTLTFGESVPLLSRGIKTVRVIGAQALNELATMAPEYNRGAAD